MDLSVVVVNFNTRSLLEECLLSVFRETKEIGFEVIVVDNHSTDGSVESVRARFPEVRLICNAENRGFAAANNQGFRIAQGKYILMLNSDTVILDGALQRMVRFLEERPHVGIAGCKLLNSDGSLQPSVRSFPSVWNLLCEASFMYLVFPKTVAFGQYHMTHFPYDTIRQVDWTSGAFLVFRREILEDLGGLDEEFFMYSEETDFCYRARQRGLTTWFFPDARIIHHWAGSSFDEPKRVSRVLGGQIQFVNKHFRGLRRIGMLSMVWFGVINRLVGYSLAGLVLAREPLLRKSRNLLAAAVHVVKGTAKGNRQRLANAEGA